MSPIQFKFSKPPDGLVRRVTFPEKPSWDVLAAKIESLYDIPVPSIGVSYVDSDGDEVTLSSEEELQDFYQSAAQQRHGDTLNLVKFTVRDLDALRNDKPLPETPRTTSAMNYRNTFGRSAPVLFEMEVEDGWQPIPSNFDARPHAFVEVLDSDVDVSQFNNTRDQDNSSFTSETTNTLPEIIPTPTIEKGKGRARSADFSRSRTPDTVSSTSSVVAEESNPKHSIHVVSMRSRGGSRSRTSTALAPRTPTPKARTPNPADQPASADDPPLPDLDNMPTQANIANDVADLFANLSNILASHPELSEGIRNVVRNVSNGTYWQSHREQVARAAEEVRRSAIISADELRQAANDSRRSAEEAAGRRVADAIGNVIRVIADINIAGAQAGEHSQQAAAGEEPATSTPLRERPFGRGLGHHLWGESWDGPGGRGRGGGPRGRGGAFRGRGGFGRGGPPSWGSFGSHWDDNGPFSGMMPPPPPFGSFPPPPGPPPPGTPPVPPPPPPGAFGHHHHGPPFGNPAGPPPPWSGPFGSRHRAGSFPMGDSPAGPPPPRFGNFGRPPTFGPPHMHHGPHDWDFEDDPFTTGRGWHDHHHHDWADTVPGLPPIPPPRPSASAEGAEVTMYGVTSTESPDAAKKALQEAKERYIAEKERYRRLREERKKRRNNVSTDSEMKDPADSPITPRDAQEPAVHPVGEPSTAAPLQDTPVPQEVPQIVSNARGPFPQLELYSVPHRSRTMHGTGHSYHRRNGSWGTFGSGASTHAGRAAAADSIVRRLDDMGFTPTKYPVLTSKVESRVPRHGEVSKEREDSIVTEIVEDLLQTSPAREPEASGSGSRAN